MIALSSTYIYAAACTIISPATWVCVLTVNVKYKPVYEIANWCILSSSLNFRNTQKLTIGETGRVYVCTAESPPFVLR